MKLAPVVLLLAVSFLQLCRCQNVIPFLCNQDSGERLCKNGGTCKPATPRQCDCSTADPPYESSLAIDCSMDTTTPCDLTCGGHGQCFTEGGEDKCLCDEGYFSDVVDDEKVCSPRAVAFSCTDDQMTIRIEPYGEFQGIIHPVGHTEPICQFGASRLNTITYDATTCGGPHAQVEEEAGTSHTVPVMMRFNSGAISTHDFIIDFKCTKAGDGGVETQTTSLVTIQAEDEASVNRITPQATSQDVGLTVSISPEGPVEIGALLTVNIILSQTGGFEDFLVDKVVIQGGAADTGTEELVLVEDTCALRTSSIRQFKKTQVGSSVIVALEVEAFRFMSGSAVSFTVTSKLCEATCDTIIPAPPDDCSDDRFHEYVKDTINDDRGMEKPVGRRKRQAVPQKTAVRNLTVGTYVVGSDEYRRIVEQVRLTDPTGDCMRDLVFILPLVLLSVMLVVATLVAVYFCLKVSRDRKYKDENGPRM